MKSEFEQFLKSKQIYWIFVWNTLVHSGPIIWFKKPFHVMKCLKNEDLWSAFVWKDSKQGHEFWCNLNDQWFLTEQLEIKT